MEWYQTESTVRPESIDTTSSNVYNYMRRNITETEIEDVTTYVYDELKIKKEDWQIYLKQEKIEADVDYLLMITEDL